MLESFVYKNEIQNNAVYYRNKDITNIYSELNMKNCLYPTQIILSVPLKYD